MTTAEICETAERLAGAHGYIMESLDWDPETAYRFAEALRDNAYLSLPNSADSSAALRALDATMLAQLLANIADARDALARLENPGALALDGRGCRVIVRNLGTYAVDTVDAVWPMRRILEAVASRRHEVVFWRVGAREQTEVMSYARTMALIDSLSGAFC